MKRLNRSSFSIGRLLTPTAWLLVTAVSAWGATPLGTALTYQGELKQNGSGVSDTCDCQFSLWDDPAGGTQVGPTLTFDGQGGNPPPIIVADGLFTVELDFGAGAFDGNARWLEIAVACPAGMAQTTLSPRQAVTAAPYALQTRGFFVDDEGNAAVGGAGSTSRLTVRSSSSDVLRLVGPGGDHGHGARLKFNDDDNFDYASIQEDEPYQLRANALRFSFMVGRVGVGTLTPAAPLDVFESGSFGSTALQAVATSAGPTTGIRGATTSATGRAMLAEATADIGTARAVEGRVESPDGYAAHFTGGRNYFEGNVGIGTNTPEWPLHVKGRVLAETSGIPIRGVKQGTGTFPGVFGETESTSSGASGVRGFVLSTAPGSTSAGVWGHNNSTTASGYGVRGSHDGSGAGVFGQAASSAGYGGFFVGRGHFSGNLGIGTTNPQEKLHVAGNSRMDGMVTHTRTTIQAVSGMTLNPPSTYVFLNYPGPGAVWLDTTNPIVSTLPAGTILILQGKNVAIPNSGNIRLQQGWGAGIALDASGSDTLMLIYDGEFWVMLSYSNNR